MASLSSTRSRNKKRKEKKKTDKTLNIFDMDLEDKLQIMLALLLNTPHLLHLPLLRPHNPRHTAVVAHQPVCIIAILSRPLQFLLLIWRASNSIVFNDIPMLIRLRKQPKEPLFRGRRRARCSSCARGRHVATILGGCREANRAYWADDWRNWCWQWVRFGLATEQVREPAFDGVKNAFAAVAAYGIGKRSRTGIVIGEDFEEANEIADLLGDVDDVNKGGDGGQVSHAVQEAVGSKV